MSFKERPHPPCAHSDGPARGWTSGRPSGSRRPPPPRRSATCRSPRPVPRGDWLSLIRTRHTDRLGQDGLASPADHHAPTRRLSLSLLASKQLRGHFETRRPLVGHGWGRDCHALASATGTKRTHLHHRGPVPPATRAALVRGANSDLDALEFPGVREVILTALFDDVAMPDDQPLKPLE